MITLYGSPGSRSLRVAWALEEAGAAYEYVRVNLMKGEGRREPFLSLNPGGKVPVLVDGDLVLTESAAICNWVGEHFPASGLVPPSATRERAQYDRWCFFALSELEQPLWTLAKHRFALPEHLRVPAINDTAKWELARAAGVLDAGLGDNTWILGDQFTAADILLGFTLSWARNAELPLGSERLAHYLDRAMARPALARARERENAAAQGT